MSSVVRVYSDGSGYKGSAGTAAVLLRTNGVHNTRRVLRCRLAPLTERLANRLKQQRDSGYSLGVSWISGHDDAELNEFVDGQANLAAEKDTSVA